MYQEMKEMLLNKSKPLPKHTWEYEKPRLRLDETQILALSTL